MTSLDFDEYERPNIAYQVGKFGMTTAGVLLLRRHVINSFIYGRRFEKWAYYFKSYENIIWHHANCMVLKMNPQNPALMYASSFGLFFSISFLCDLAYHFWASDITNEKNADGQKRWMKLANTSVKSIIFCNLFVSKKPQINLAFLAMGNAFSIYVDFLRQTVPEMVD